jgi:hypothetical protein
MQLFQWLMSDSRSKCPHEVQYCYKPWETERWGSGSYILRTALSSIVQQTSIMEDLTVRKSINQLHEARYS